MKLPLIIQKFGGATLETPEKLKSAALKVAELKKSGHNVVAVVSAMGKTTNDLIRLAHKVSPNPLRRELDMLLSTGERVSMALMSIALNELDCSAISFTGSQAGVFTDRAHQNAAIKNIKPFRVTEALDQGQVVVLAGFQGVAPDSKEITTLGRGGTDTTAVAMAAALHADRCEILKDVPAVFTGDPSIVKDAKPISKLTYNHLLDMTFWGAKVLHYRSVELAKMRRVNLYVGPAHGSREGHGTFVVEKIELQKGQVMFEKNEILSVNSHDRVLEIYSEALTCSEGVKKLHDFLLECEIAFPQILGIEERADSFSLYITGPEEIMSAIARDIHKNKFFKIAPKIFSSVTATCAGSTRPEVTGEILSSLANHNIHPSRTWMSAMSATVLVEQKERERALSSIHSLIGRAL